MWGGSTPGAYCTSQASNNNYEWIEGVTVGSFTNTSGAAFYSDFTSMEIDLDAGSSYSISLDPGFASSSYAEYWKIWIDLDQNNVFDESTEEVFSGSGSSVVNGNITIPSSATSGATRMRVSMQWNAGPSSCGGFTYGEVEDYTINVVGGDSLNARLGGLNTFVTDELKARDVLYPNPATESVKLPFGTKGEMLPLKVYNINGQEMKAPSYNKDSQELDISALPKGLYMIQIGTPEGVKTKRLIIE